MDNIIYIYTNPSINTKRDRKIHPIAQLFKGYFEEDVQFFQKEYTYRYDFQSFYRTLHYRCFFRYSRFRNLKKASNMELCLSGFMRNSNGNIGISKDSENIIINYICQLNHTLRFKLLLEEWDLYCNAKHTVIVDNSLYTTISIPCKFYDNGECSCISICKICQEVRFPIKNIKGKTIESASKVCYCEMDDLFF